MILTGFIAIKYLNINNLISNISIRMYNFLPKRIKYIGYTILNIN